MTRKLAGLLAGMTAPVELSTFSTRCSPPMMKQAAPALRAPAGELDGDCVFLATLQIC